MTTKTFAVIYRTGGTENFKWHRVADRFTRETAIAKRDELQKAGYPAHIAGWDASMSIGLPETFAPKGG